MSHFGCFSEIVPTIYPFHSYFKLFLFCAKLGIAVREYDESKKYIPGQECVGHSIIKPETQDIHTRSNFLLAKLADRNIINNNTFINTRSKQKLIQLMGPCKYQVKNMLIEII